MDDNIGSAEKADTSISNFDLRSVPRFTYRTALLAAVGGSLFGYDIGVISGAEKLLKHSFNLTAVTEEIAVAAVLFGAIIGGLIGGAMANWLSRRYTLFALGILYIVGAVATALAPTLGWFIAFRIGVGVAVGGSSMVVPMYIAEMAPTEIRGGMVILQQLAISGGIFLSYVVDYAVASAGWGWRPMFAAAVVPGIVLAAGILISPHSPRWLAIKGRWGDAAQVLDLINPTQKEEALSDLRKDMEARAGTSSRDLFKPGMRGALIAAVGLAIFQQFVGPNTVLFYTPTIFGYAGVSGGKFDLLPTIYVGAALFAFVIPTILLVDRIGRKMLFYIGLAVMGAMLVLLGIAFDTGASSWGVIVLIILLVYVAAYSLSISPLFWLMSAEVFPNRLRGLGASYATVANWSADLLITVTFLSLIKDVGKDVTFWIYAGFAALAVVFVWAWVPETKGRSLEEIASYWRSRANR